MRTKLPVFFYNQGRGYYDRGLYDAAIVSFKKSLKINPRIAIVHCSMADAYMEKKMQDEAIEEYKKTIQLNPNYIYAYRALSHIYWTRQMYEEALDQLKQAEILNPANQEIKELQEEISSEYMADCLNKGIDSFLAGDRFKADALLDKVLEIKPDSAFANYTLAYFYFAEKKYEETERLLDKVIQIDSQFWPAYKLLGDIYFEKGIYEKAVSEYKTALTLNYNNPNLHNELGLALVQMERYEEAIMHLQEALKLDPNNLNIRYSLASTFRDKGMFEEAISEHKKITENQKDYPNLYNDLGDIYSQQGKIQEALEAYQNEISYDRRRISLNPDDPVALNNLAYALTGIGEYNQAKEIVEKILILQPNYRQAYLTLAKIYEKLGNSKEALVALAKAKSISIQANFINRDIARLKKKLKPSFDTVFLPVDTVYLKNGRQIKGRIKKEDGEKVILEVQIGNTIGDMTFYRNAIERIEKASKY